MKAKFSVLLRSTLIYAPAIFLTRISALLLLIIATRLIDQTEYGLLTLVVTVGEMTDVAVTNWLRIALLRLGGKGEISRGSLWLAARVLAATTLVAFVISIVASTLIVPERWMEFALAVCTYLVVGAVGRYALTVLQMQQRHTAYSLLEFVRAILQLLLPIGAIALFHDSFLMVSLASSLAVFIAGCAALWLALGRTVAGPSRFTYGELFALGVPLIITALVGFGLNNAERVILKVFYDAGSVAIFAAAYSLARQPIDMVANAINTGAFPEMVSRFDRQGPAAAAQFLSQLMALMMRLCLPIAALLTALGHDITALVLPADYQGHVGALFPIIAVSVLFGNLTSFVFENVIHAHKRNWLLIGLMAPGSVATIGLSLLLIPAYAEIGAALALAGGSLVTLIASVVVSHRLTPVPVPWASIGLSALVAVATGVVAALASAALGDVWPVFKLAAGGFAGGVMFLGLNSLLHPVETRRFAGMVRSRLGIA
ncbi:lipopolysaccharide biosynthesis protein [Devosia sp.]|uniref:lipopolysaccharide biosynthesis protein n=1 Tax=Devosia sp. TaxID=1871048 RepID=UPI003BA9058D